MSTPYLLIDSNVIINLFAADGTAGWDALLKVPKPLMVLELVIDELEAAVESTISRARLHAHHALQTGQTRRASP